MSNPEHRQANTPEQIQKKAWIKLKALSLAVGIGLAGCAKEASMPKKHNHPMTKEELTRRVGFFEQVDLVDIDEGYSYFRISPFTFIKIENTQANQQYIEDIYRHWKNNRDKAETKDDKKKVDDFYREKLLHELTAMGTVVE